ncbi:hypothetical protein QJQ45_028362, partial [Haematococcus lacustris]
PSIRSSLRFTKAIGPGDRDLLAALNIRRCAVRISDTAQHVTRLTLQWNASDLVDGTHDCGAASSAVRDALTKFI